MMKRLSTKAVVCLIVCIFLGTILLPIRNVKGDTSEKPADQQYYSNQMSDGNSVICGYVTDNETGGALEIVNVDISWEDFEGNQGWDSIFTNSTGFYLFNTAAVEFRLYFYYDDYFNEYTSTFTVWDNQIFWFNISLIPIPEQTVHIQGYLIDNTSGEPIQAADVDLNWYEQESSHNWHNYTTTNSSGYYYIGAIPGETRIQVHCENYFQFYSEEFYTQNNSLIWMNISLNPFPTVSAVICGYITDDELGDPIPDAGVSLYCYTEYGQFYNHTYSNEIGFYTFGTIPGNVDISCYRSGYDSSSTSNHEINENETLWINLTMTYQPNENSQVKGYVVDGETHAAVRNAFIRYDWKDEVGHFYSKSTFTDQKGYYWITAPAGPVQFFITGNGYTNQQTSWFFINEYSNSWLNASLEPEITLVFDKPQPGVYINNQLRFPILSQILMRFFPNSIPLIIGPLEITVNITKSSIMGCARVEFYIDGVYLGTDSEEPFTCNWNKKSSFKHEIQVIAYDNAGPCTIETITVRKFM